MSNPFSLLATGALLQDRYRIKKLIGKGGMGAVYEARDERLGHSVALKQNFHGGDEKLKLAFEREAKLLASLRHSALPRVTDHFTADNGQFLVMDFIPGEDLMMMLNQRGEAFPVDQILIWAEQLLDVLEYLHTQDPPIIHRDLKPQNLKLNSQGGMILLDFGLAKGTVAGLTSMMAGSSVMGYTPGYAPLEQMTGKGTDERSDLYSLGATLYHLLTNQAPTDSVLRSGEISIGDPDPLPPASDLNGAVPPAFSDLLMSAMAQRRNDRPRDTSEVRKALKQCGSIQQPNDFHDTRTIIEVRKPVDPVSYETRREPPSPQANYDTAPAQQTVAGQPDSSLRPTTWQAFVKFFGGSGKRVARSQSILETVRDSGCHLACTYPKGRRPRKVRDGAVMYMGRMVEAPNDILIFGKAVGMHHEPGRDDATTADIQRDPWKADYPHYIRVRDPEFIAGSLANGISLNELSGFLKSDAFATTQRNKTKGKGNTDPSWAYRQQPAVELSPEATKWLNKRLQRAYEKHGKLEQVSLMQLDGPETHFSDTNPRFELTMKDAAGTRMCEIAFSEALPPPDSVDRIVREFLEREVQKDSSSDILAMAFLGDDALNDNQYSGELVYVAAKNEILTMDEARGVKTYTHSMPTYFVEIREHLTLEGIEPQRRWLSLTIIFPTTPRRNVAYDAILTEIQKVTNRGLDVSAYVSVGDKNVKTSRYQMKDYDGAFVFAEYGSATKKVTRKGQFLKQLD